MGSVFVTNDATTSINPITTDARNMILRKLSSHRCLENTYSGPVAGFIGGGVELVG
jgi:hypothetical protein